MHFLFRVIHLLLTLALLATSAHAQMQLSGFGTFGAAISDQNFVYQRFIDNGGTLERDSLLGIQLDACLTPAWGLTLQTKAAASSHSDTDSELTLSWAFLSWRPDNDLLLRAGKLRLPLLLYSANSDVGNTFAFARLPLEMYSLLPTTDVNGLSFAKTWFDGAHEWTLEGYAGTTHTDWRYYLRDEMPPLFAAGTTFFGYDLKMIGALLSLHEHKNTWRIGLHRTNAECDCGAVPVKLPFVTLVPGTDIGYYKVADTMPGPNIEYVNDYVLYLLTFGAEFTLPNNFQLIGEFGQRRFENAAIAGPNSNSAYLGLLKRIGRWRPYLYWTAIRSRPQALKMADALNHNQLPEIIPEAAAINASQRAGSDMFGSYDQQSLAIGTAYHLSPKTVIKAEWLYTRTGVLSSFVNAPAGEESGGREINVFSLSYSLTF
ncbi:hypothetical protein [Chromatium okenii]|uniref:hypothetical protein n=1 Tax=Chromatium okenii TaxID=61644 RepID=UPI0026ED4F41|nr:hypothetical protein [Chromatium okenii]MBV5310045.1 hypothetical protein [Chromatium okenii]